MERQYQEFQVAMRKVLHTITYPWKFIVKKTRARGCLAELLGTFILCTIGNCAIAQAVLSGAPHATGGPYGTFQSINIGYALGLTIAVYVSIEASGAHLNPAVTWAMAIRGGVSWLMVVPYMIAQFLGAFFSSVVVFAVYYDGIKDANPNKLELGTAGIFATYPIGYLSVRNGFFDQVLGTFFLLIGILAITDARNHEVKAGLKPLLIGIVLWAVGSSLGINGGYGINPARDFGPRVFTAIAGWGKEVFDCSNCSISHWWWIPIVGPFVGATLAVFIYWIFIEAHHTTPAEEGNSINSTATGAGMGVTDGEGYYPVDERTPLTMKQ